jgi:hypothetical protein
MRESFSVFEKLSILLTSRPAVGRPDDGITDHGS